MYKTCITCAFVFFCLTRQCIAQNGILRFGHIGLEDGLSNERVTAILQDSRGYLWFGTFDGLNKYDGYTFTKYKFDPLDSNSVSQNLIYTIFEDRQGVIWVSTVEGLCRFDRSTEKFTRYRPSPQARFADPNIAVINEDSDGMIWVGSFSSGLCRFNPKTGKFLPDSIDLNYPRSVDNRITWLEDAVHAIYANKTGELWVGNTTGLHHITLTATKPGQPSGYNIKSYRHDPLNPFSLSKDTVTAVYEDKGGTIWVATNHGFNRFDKKSGSFTRYFHDPKNMQSISSNHSSPWGGRGIREDQEGNLWICTSNGLNKLNKDRTVFTRYVHNPKDLHSLSTNDIAGLEIDKAGILWVASEGGRLNKANLNDRGFGLRRNDPADLNSLSSNEVTSLVEDSSGIIWIGTHSGGLNRWDKRTNRFTHFRHDPTNPKSLMNDAVQAILEDRLGNLWVGNGHVLSLLDKQTGAFTHYTGNEANNSEALHSILSITEDREGLLWLGLAGEGIKSFDTRTRKFIKHYQHSKTDSTGISDYTAIAIFADSRDHIWVGYGSIATDRINKRTGRITHYKHDPQDTSSISSNIVNTFFEDSKGNLWLGTWAGGLCRFDYIREKFATFTDKHGLSDNTIYSVIEDNNKWLWIGTQNGLSRFDPVTRTFFNYDYTDGLQGNMFAAGVRNRGARFKGRDGTLYFGGMNGISFFDPLEVSANSPVAPVVITQFKLFDKPVKGAGELKAIVLNHNENYFSFEFASLSFYNPGKNQYAYKLEGVDKDWIYSGTRRYVSYTNIEPGSYTFRIKGTNNDGIWNETGTFIPITINPPWWRTWWAYTLWALLFAAFIYALFRYRLNKVRMEHEIVLRQHKAEQLEIEGRQALLYERLRISRELHDDIGSTLGSISIYSEVAKKRTEKKENADEVLYKIGLVSRELIGKMSDIVWSLNPENERFEQLRHRILTFAAMMLSPRNITLEFTAAEELKDLNVSGEKRKNIYLIFKEALHNVVKYAACRTVRVSLSIEDNQLVMVIQDDGIGFDVDARVANNHSSSVSSAGAIGGSGLKNMYARAAAMNAKLSIDSKENEGTTVSLVVNV